MTFRSFFYGLVWAVALCVPEGALAEDGAGTVLHDLSVGAYIVHSRTCKTECVIELHDAVDGGHTWGMAVWMKEAEEGGKDAELLDFNIVILKPAASWYSTNSSVCQGTLGCIVEENSELYKKISSISTTIMRKYAAKQKPQ